MRRNLRPNCFPTTRAILPGFVPVRNSDLGASPPSNVRASTSRTRRVGGKLWSSISSSRFPARPAKRSPGLALRRSISAKGPGMSVPPEPPLNPTGSAPSAPPPLSSSSSSCGPCGRSGNLPCANRSSRAAAGLTILPGPPESMWAVMTGVSLPRRLRLLQRGRSRHDLAFLRVGDFYLCQLLRGPAPFVGTAERISPRSAIHPPSRGLGGPCRPWGHKFPALRRGLCRFGRDGAGRTLQPGRVRQSPFPAVARFIQTRGRAPPRTRRGR